MRFNYIDFAKGIGILLVIIGHGLMNNFAINVFHMPLFFFLTGLTFTPPSLENLEKFIIKKVNRILIPYIFFMIVSAVLELIIGKLSPDGPLNGPLWFLDTLFTSLMIYAALHIIFKQKITLNIICLLFPILAFVLTKYTEVAKVFPFGLLRCLEATAYIHLGWFYNKYSANIRINRFLLLIVSTSLFILGVVCSYRFFDVQAATFLNARAYTYNLPLSLITAVSGIMMIVSLSEIIGMIKFVNWLGRNSLVVVCVHFPLLERLNYFCFYCFTELGVTSMPIKVLLAVCSYVVTIAFCCIAIWFCKKVIPKLSGYGGLIPI